MKHPPKKSKHFYNQTRVHESNYSLLCALLGDLAQLKPCYQLSLAEDTQLKIKLKEQHRYTAIIELFLSLPQISPFQADLRIEARVYLDAQVVEVTHYQGHGRFAVQCETPHHKGYHADEKQQINGILQDSLRYCLHLTQQA